MILYHPLLATSLEKCGIKIPLHDNRSREVFRILKRKFPFLRECDLSLLPRIHREDLLLAHDSDFIGRWLDERYFLSEILMSYDCFESYSYDSKANSKALSFLKESILRQISATSFGLQRALDLGFCYFLGGGMHHARSSFGSGFCPLNDIVIAIRRGQKKGLLKNVLVLDVDAHMGDGTAEITQTDKTVTTISLHMGKSWPLETQLPRVHSTYDYSFLPGEEGRYLRVLQEALEKVEAEEFDLIFVVDGADPYEGDELKSTEGMKLSKEQLLQRDVMIFQWAKKKSLPQFWVMAGGYGVSTPQIYCQFLSEILHLVGKDSFLGPKISARAVGKKI